MPVTTERLRQRYRPKRITLLLVGESPPARGTFFYAEDSTLYWETKRVFESVFTDVIVPSVSFLLTFQRLGCYLDDLCHEPVNHLPAPERYSKCLEAVPSLAQRMVSYTPAMIVVVGKTTAWEHVQAAANEAMLTVPMRAISYPRWPAHKESFRRDLATTLTSMRREGLLPS